MLQNLQCMAEHAVNLVYQSLVTGLAEGPVLAAHGDAVLPLVLDALGAPGLTPWIHSASA